MWCLLTRFLPISAAASIYTYRQPPSGQSLVYRATQLRTDGVHCRESNGTGPVALKVVPVAGAAFSGFTVVQLMCASLFPHPQIGMKWTCAIQRESEPYADNYNIRTFMSPRKTESDLSYNCTRYNNNRPQLLVTVCEKLVSTVA